MSYRKTLIPQRALSSSLGLITDKNLQSLARQNWTSAVKADITDYNSGSTLTPQNTAGTPTYTQLQTVRLPPGRWILTTFVNIKIDIYDPSVGIPDYKDPTISSRLVIGGTPSVTKTESISTQGQLSSLYGRVQRIVEPVILTTSVDVALEAFGGGDLTGIGICLVFLGRGSLVAFPG